MLLGLGSRGRGSNRGPAFTRATPWSGRYHAGRAGFESGLELAQEHGARRDADPAGDEDAIVLLGLVHRGAADQAHAFVHAVDAVDVGLGELPAMGVAGEPPAQLQGAVLDEILRLAGAAEAELLELEEAPGPRASTFGTGRVPTVRGSDWHWCAQAS